MHPLHMTMVRLATFGFWIALPTFALPTIALAQDTVKLRSGETETGRVDAENFDVLVFKAKKAKEKEERVMRLSWDNVVEVTYGGNVEYQQAIQQVASGNFGVAIPKLQALSEGAHLRKELKPLVMFQLGSAMQRAGKFAEAAAVQRELAKQFPKSHYLLGAAQSIVDCHIALNDAAGGTAAIDELVNAAASGGVDPNYLAAFDYFRGRLLEEQKNVAGAKTKYQAVAAGRTGSASMTAMARMRIARCEQAEGQVEQAKTAYRALVDLDVGNEVLAGAWNGLADISLAEAAKAPNPEKLTNALLMYLRGVVEYGPAPGESTGEHERALFGASQIFKQLSDIETDEAKKKLHSERSKQRLAQLKKEFPNSVYLK